jgi:hypothetical protein
LPKASLREKHNAVVIFIKNFYLLKIKEIKEIILQSVTTDLIIFLYPLACPFGDFVLTCPPVAD